jgi:hypothetical protein
MSEEYPKMTDVYNVLKEFDAKFLTGTDMVLTLRFGGPLPAIMLYIPAYQSGLYRLIGVDSLTENNKDMLLGELMNAFRELSARRKEMMK